MPLHLHPDLEAPLTAAAAAVAELSSPTAGDVLGLRTFINPILESSMKALPDYPGLSVTSYEIAVSGGTIEVRLYRAPDATPGPAALYIHGGGMVSGSLDIYDPLVRHYAAMARISILAVDYRLAPEHRKIGLAHDVIAALNWVIVKADELNIDKSRIALMGDSGGGGIAAAAAIMARDLGVVIAKQVLIYPMLDDATIDPDPFLLPFAQWTYEFNRTAWTAVLEDRTADHANPSYVVPARLDNFVDLAPTYIEVGELDIFRNECVEYARRCFAAGVSCELHVRAGCPHFFESADWNSALSRRAFEDRFVALRSI